MQQVKARNNKPRSDRNSQTRVVHSPLRHELKTVEQALGVIREGVGVATTVFANTSDSHNNLLLLLLAAARTEHIQH